MIDEAAIRNRTRDAGHPRHRQPRRSASARIPRNQRVIDGVSLQVREGETLCLVGESGSGKSVTSLTVMGLLPKGSLVPSGGSIKLVGEDMLAASDRRLRQLRATTMAMIFQEPMTALNPVVPVGRQIDEVLRAHTDLDARARASASSP